VAYCISAASNFINALQAALAVAGKGTYMDASFGNGFEHKTNNP
jgi:hypothetical protein